MVMNGGWFLIAIPILNSPFKPIVEAALSRGYLEASRVCRSTATIGLEYLWLQVPVWYWWKNTIKSSNWTLYSNRMVLWELVSLCRPASVASPPCGSPHLSLGHPESWLTMQQTIYVNTSKIVLNSTCSSIIHINSSHNSSWNHVQIYSHNFKYLFGPHSRGGKVKVTKTKAKEKMNSIWQVLESWLRYNMCVYYIYIYSM